jgi:ubiquinone/menaquinone biosynthesis C-methylase UbiE
MSAPAPTSAPVTPERVFQYGWGFAVTQTLATAIDLDLFSLIAAGHRTADALAKAAKATPRGMRMVADAVAGLGLLTKDAKGYGLAPDAQLFLVKSSPAYMGEFMRFHAAEIADSWRGLTETVRTGKPHIAVDKPAEGIPFWQRLVDALFPVGYAAAKLVGEELNRRHPTGPIRLLDVAAGSGVWGIGAAHGNSRVKPTEMDLAETLELTKKWVARMNVGDRVSYLAGDLRTAEFGVGKFEAAILGHICHSEGAENSKKLLAKVGRSLVKGGTIVIVDFVPDDGRSSPPNALLFALNMLMLTSEGDTFTFAEYRAWLTAAGFKDVVQLPAPAPSPLILATKA